MNSAAANDDDDVGDCIGDGSSSCSLRSRGWDDSSSSCSSSSYGTSDDHSSGCLGSHNSRSERSDAGSWSSSSDSDEYDSEEDSRHVPPHDKLINASTLTFRSGVLPIVQQGMALREPAGPSTLTRRRVKVDYSESERSPQGNDEFVVPSKPRARRRPRTRRHGRTLQKVVSLNGSCCMKKLSTQLLIVAFVAWILSQCYHFHYASITRFLVNHSGGLFGPSSFRYHSANVNMHTWKTPEQMKRLRDERYKEARTVLGSGAGDETVDSESQNRGGKRIKQRQKNKKKGSRDHEGNLRKERLKPGCTALDWHSYHFPNCNEIHEIDLRSVTKGRRQTKRSDSFPWGFVGAGLWRDVFSCDPRSETELNSTTEHVPFPPAVLKLMKSEHEYEMRNMQRHRRDALVMERLSSSHHLVAIYGYCAQAVLTKSISHTLDDVIYAREYEKVKRWKPNGGYQFNPPLESWMGVDQDGELLATRETEKGRLKLALGVFRGLKDLHHGDGRTNQWLPIVHADLQAKQYLVDSSSGRVYLNDFNRCRFMPAVTNSTSLESCSFQIPSAPGGSRSPEEYDLAPLSEKLDVYSAGNILYGIITGKKPWDGEKGKKIKTLVQLGERPQVEDSIRNTEGTVDFELVKLLDRVYEADPNKRASASDVVAALERISRTFHFSTSSS